MSEAKTRPTNVSVDEFLAGVPEPQQQDCRALVFTSRSSRPERVEGRFKTAGKCPPECARPAGPSCSPQRRRSA